jgi:hypothetical protein
MSTSPMGQWPDDPFERMEAKLDAYRDEHRKDMHGDPADPSRIGLSGRMSNVERDVALFKKGGALVGVGAMTALADLLKRKFGIGQ